MNIYLINAESYKIIEQEIKKIVGKEKYVTFNLNRSSIKELLEEASYFSFDNKKRYIVATNADFFGSVKIDENDADRLLKYIENPNAMTVLIFTTLKGIDSKKKIVKAIKAKEGLINIAKFDKRGQNAVLTDYLKQDGYTIDYDTLNYIMDNCYGNLDIMFNELDKIKLYYSYPGKVRYDDVVKIVGEELESNNFHFVNAVISKDLKLALKILKSLKVYKVETTSLVILLAREYRLMYYVQALKNKMSPRDMCNYLNLADWQINKLYNNSLNYTKKELLNNLIFLCDIDLNIKKGIWDKDTILYSFLLESCN